MGKEILRLSGVSVNIGTERVLENIDLSVDSRDYLAIIGPNGSGKTTLLKVILGLIKPDRGEVSVFGKSAEEARRVVGYLPQHSHFDPDFPINIFNTVLISRYRGSARGATDEDRNIVERALKTLDIYSLRERQIGSLSGGELQRVFLARALAREPRLLLLDEPTASIDTEMQHSFYEILEELRGRMAIIMVSHDIGVVFSHVNKVACLNRRLHYHGPTEGASEAIEEMYKCPIELIGHGLPHRVLKDH